MRPNEPSLAGHVMPQLPLPAVCARNGVEDCARFPPLACRYLQATAALVQFPTSSVSRELLRLLCWVPAKRFCLPMQRTAVMAWHWVLAAGSAELQAALLAEIAAAWAFTARARLGLTRKTLISVGHLLPRKRNHLTIAALVGHDGHGYPGGGSQCHWLHHVSIIVSWLVVGG